MASQTHSILALWGAEGEERACMCERAGKRVTTVYNLARHGEVVYNVAAPSKFDVALGMGALLPSQGWRSQRRHAI